MKKTTAEFEIKVSDCHQKEDIFKKVLASELRLDDAFLKHHPKTLSEGIFKEMVEDAIKNGLKDFWRPIYDPSFDGYGRICYEPGKKPALGKSYIWWEKKARKFYPKRGSRLGTKDEYIAFLAVLIKELVASGKSIEWAWNAVCNNSRELGHYRNSKDAKSGFEPTGSREVCGWYDLANTYKILADDEENGPFCIVGGACVRMGYEFPLADWIYRFYRGGSNDFHCGWLVLESGSIDE